MPPSAALRSPQSQPENKDPPTGRCKAGLLARSSRNAFPAGAPARLTRDSLGLGGSAYTLDAACASSLYAIKLACDELRTGRADAMLAGGVSRP